MHDLEKLFKQYCFHGMLANSGNILSDNELLGLVDVLSFPRRRESIFQCFFMDPLVKPGDDISDKLKNF